MLKELKVLRVFKMLAGVSYASTAYLYIYYTIIVLPSILGVIDVRMSGKDYSVIVYVTHSIIYSNV